jgi:hypothetical protein
LPFTIVWSINSITIGKSKTEHSKVMAEILIVPPFLEGGGEMAEFTTSYHASSTAQGPVET